MWPQSSQLAPICNWCHDKWEQVWHRLQIGASKFWVRRQQVLGTVPAEPRSGALFIEATYPKEPEPRRGGLYDDFTGRPYGTRYL